MLHIIHKELGYMLPYFGNPLVKPKLKVKRHPSHPFTLVFNGMSAGAKVGTALHSRAGEQIMKTKKREEDTRRPHQTQESLTTPRCPVKK